MEKALPRDNSVKMSMDDNSDNIMAYITDWLTETYLALPYPHSMQIIIVWCIFLETVQPKFKLHIFTGEVIACPMFRMDYCSYGDSRIKKAAQIHHKLNVHPPHNWNRLLKMKS